MTVSIGYAYPTSPYAKAYGFYKTGCYVVEIDDELSSKGIAGFATFQEAKDFADKTGYPYHRYSMTQERG